jgi:hypothetical protein
MHRQRENFGGETLGIGETARGVLWTPISRLEVQGLRIINHGGNLSLLEVRPQSISAPMQHPKRILVKNMVPPADPLGSDKLRNMP